MATGKIIKLIGLITVLLICACNPYDDSTTERRETAKESDSEAENTNTAKSQDTVFIGVAWPNEDANFVKGVQLAIKEINDDGGVLGKPYANPPVPGRLLDTIINEGEGNISDNLTLRQKQDITVQVARSFAANPRVIAVTGHRSSDQAIPASIVYQFHGIAFLAPTSTNLSLTDHNFNYVFRMVPNNEEIAKQLANYCHQKGYKKIVILHTKSSYGSQLADSFFSSFVKKPNTEKEQQTEVVLLRSFFLNKTDFSDLMVELKRAKKEDDFDVIFIATYPDMAARIYQDTRDMGFKEPFIGAEVLDNLMFWENVKEWEIYEEAFTEKSVVPTLFNTTAKDSISKNFIENFKTEYGFEADLEAALGYDSIKILVHGIKKANSTQPFKIAETLRYMPPCQAVTGKYQFKMDGDVRPRKFYFKRFRYGQFEYKDIGYEQVDLDEHLASGKKVRECGNIDQDQDGIPNDKDACPDDNLEEISKIDKDNDLYDKGVLRGCLVDNDKDKVPDYRDNCPDTKRYEFKEGINSDGCPVDHDKDGVPDYRDECPKNTRFEIRTGVDSSGCLVDTDKDKVPDYKDVCPKDSLTELSKGVYQQGDHIGCPIDSDNDNVPDYRDDCPQNLPNEMEKGLDLRGCPVDRDKDEVPDYRDACPKNKHFELTKGVDSHGCPIDTDQDRIPDYKDVCLKNSPEEISKGVFQQGTHLGCPIDGDQDGVLDYRDDCLNNSPIEIGKGVNSRGCPRDTDKDEVPDYKDVCFNNSPTEISKGVHQQGIHIGCPMDKDRDGVLDYRDDCLNNSPIEIGKGVDSRGCPRDTDKDEVPDYKDACFNNSPTEISKGVHQQGIHIGCPMDKDRDGVPDYRDSCPDNSRLEIRKGVDSRGCPNESKL
jgi:ABC-type branched-subunit amino acid transport system substrate-binding protein